MDINLAMNINYEYYIYLVGINYIILKNYRS